MTRKTYLGTALATALCLAGCGSGAERQATPQPRLHRQLATALAERSADVAQALDAGNSCEALRLARDLQLQTIAAINARRVPPMSTERAKGRRGTVKDTIDLDVCRRPVPRRTYSRLWRHGSRLPRSGRGAAPARRRQGAGRQPRR